MTDKEKDLEKIDKLTRTLMIQFLENGETERLADLATPSNYLAKNNRVEEKKKSTVEEDIRKRVEEAKKRRESDDV
jgi:hypothetical protein